MFPSGRTGTASAKASPSRASRSVAAAASRRARATSRRGRTGAPTPSSPPRGRRGRQARAEAPRPERPGSDPRPCGRVASAPPSRSAPASAAALGRRAGSRSRARLTAAMIGFGRSGRSVSRPGAPSLDRAGGLEQRAPPEGMAAGECLPQHHADRPDVGGLGGERAGKRSGADVGERSGNVALGGQGLGLLDLGEAEVEHLRVNAAALRQQDVRRLDVTVDDPAPVCVRQGLEDLGRKPRSPTRRRARRFARLRGTSDPGRTRRRCRRAASRGRTP